MDLTTPVSKAGRAYALFATRAEKLGINILEDLLFHFPHRYDDFSVSAPISRVQIGNTATIRGVIQESKTEYTKKNFKIQKVTIEDNSGTIQCIWFNQPYIPQVLKKSDTVSIVGRVDFFGNKKVVMVKDYEKLLSLDARGFHTQGYVPVYPETRGLTSKWIRNRVKELLDSHKFTEYLPEEILKKYAFLSFDQALRLIHFPPSLQDAEKARKRLSFDELFLTQLQATQRRAEWQQKISTHPFEITKHQKKVDSFIASLPFQLTTSQQKAVQEIVSDISKTQPMNRLLEGDVGSGKTIVATIIIYVAYLNGFESALMAPTQILAEQHHKTISSLLTPLGISVGFVSGGKKPNTKHPQQSFDVMIGTHAILNEKLVFNKLGLVVIDEQQRFGVEQRAMLRNKGTAPHFLTMTATPIPRTVFLTMYGDLDVSFLTDMPHGRKKVKTWVVPEVKRDSAYAWIEQQLSKSKNRDQAFIVCPFIEESENATTVKAALKEYERLSKDVFPHLKLGLLHGKMKAKEKDDVLQEFKNGEINILVSTPVVEVGIDIPNATIMLIEAADRFGLAQLHQLRGRVGRNDRQAYCLLFSDSESFPSIKRLKNLESIYNGAELAEIDMKLRGPGDLYGVMQHGVPKLKIASFSDFDLIDKSKQEAQSIFPNLSKYPNLLDKLSSQITLNISPD